MWSHLILEQPVDLCPHSGLYTLWAELKNSFINLYSDEFTFQCRKAPYQFTQETRAQNIDRAIDVYFYFFAPTETQFRLTPDVTDWKGRTIMALKKYTHVWSNNDVDFFQTQNLTWLTQSLPAFHLLGSTQDTQANVKWAYCGLVQSTHRMLAVECLGPLNYQSQLSIVTSLVMVGATWGWVREEDCTFLQPMVNADLNPVAEIQKTITNWWLALDRTKL